MEGLCRPKLYSHRAGSFSIFSRFFGGDNDDGDGDAAVAVEDDMAASSCCGCWPCCTGSGGGMSFARPNDDVDCCNVVDCELDSDSATRVD